MASRHLWPIICIPVLLIAMSGCGAAPPPEFLYAVTLSGVPNSPSFQLSSFKVDSSTGVLSPASTTTLGSEIIPSIAVNPASTFLYLSDPSANAIDIFSISPINGAPTGNGAFTPPVIICPFCSVPSSVPGALALDPSGRFLYYGSSFVGLGVGLGVVQGIGALAVNSTTGALSGVAGSPFPADQAPLSVLVHPSGQFVYTENINGASTPASGFSVANISGFAVGSSNGALAPVPGSPFLAPANADFAGFAMHPSGKFLYASTGQAANGILAWSVDGATGSLAALPGSPFAAGVATFDPALDPGGRFLYVSAGATGGILGFNVDANTGALTPLASSPFSSGTALLGPVVDPSGRFLFAMDSQNSAIAGFNLNATTGALTALGNPTSVGAQPESLTIVKAPQVAWLF